MKISKYNLISLALLSFVILFTFGCTTKDTSPINENPTFKGYILDVERGTVLVAYDITADKYNHIKDKSLKELSNNEEYIPLIYLSYNDTNNLKIGDKISIWIDGGIDDSYPQQAAVKKIKVLN